MIRQFDEFGVCAFDAPNLRGAKFGKIRLASGLAAY